MAAEVRVGTSGYHFRDWVGTVYPRGLSASELLPYYARMFDCLEVNTSFYRVPDPSLFEGMLERVPETFLFAVKIPKEMTHARDRLDGVVDPFLRGIEPLRDAGRLGGLLAQFPYAFKPDAGAIAHLERLAEALAGAGIPVNVEFRHDGWYRDETFSKLREIGLGFVNVDLPRLPRLPSPSNVATTSVAYYRLHGRNAEMWWNHPTSSHRYDYSYADEDLKGWTERIEEMRPQVDLVFVFTNNCRMGASVVDALRMKQLLDLDTLIPPSRTGGDLFRTEPEDPLDAMRQRVSEARERGRPEVERWKARRQDAP
jgi:uncharacterized protein YecE (DUF72 family)